MEHVTYRGAVHLHHLDHMGHMNVQHYVGMFDHATWILLAELGLTAEWFATRIAVWRRWSRTSSTNANSVPAT